MNHNTLLTAIIIFTIIILGGWYYFSLIVPTGKDNTINVTVPKPNQTITSPLAIQGEARGTWFFEASFPIRLVDGNGNELGFTVAQAQGDWMTKNFVPFSATLTFTTPIASTGTLILQKDNPSGLLENDDKVSIPVTF